MEVKPTQIRLKTEGLDRHQPLKILPYGIFSSTFQVSPAGNDTILKGESFKSKVEELGGK